MFSIITMAASTIAPMAMAMPPRLMMLAFTPMARMTMKEMKIPNGRVTIATSDDRKWRRKMIVTSATMSDSSRSLVRRFSIARSMRLERS